MKREVRKIGSSTGLILPEELLKRLNIAQGDWLAVTEDRPGSLKLSPLDSTFEKGMAIAEKAMTTYRNTLTDLAK